MAGSKETGAHAYRRFFRNFLIIPVAGGLALVVIGVLLYFWTMSGHVRRGAADVRDSLARSLPTADLAAENPAAQEEVAGKWLSCEQVAELALVNARDGSILGRFAEGGGQPIITAETLRQDGLQDNEWVVRGDYHLAPVRVVGESPGEIGTYWVVAVDVRPFWSAAIAHSVVLAIYSFAGYFLFALLLGVWMYRTFFRPLVRVRELALSGHESFWRVGAEDTIFGRSLVGDATGKTQVLKPQEMATELESLLERLKDDQAVFRSIYEQLPVGVFLAGVDGGCEHVNPRFCAFAGMSEEEARGEGWLEGLDARSRERVREAWEQLREGNPVVTTLTSPGAGEQGRVFQVSAEPLRGARGELSGYLAVATDVTEVEEALRQADTAQKRFEMLLDQAGAFAWDVDADALYTYLSPSVEGILGYKPEELENRVHVYEAFPPEDVEEMKRHALDLIGSGEPIVDFENQMMAKDGTTVWLLTNGVPLFDDAGNIAGYRGFDFNITARKEAEEALRASEELFRKVFHDHAAVKMMLDPETGAIVDANRAAVEFYGWTREELLRMRIQEINTLDADSIALEMAKVREQERVYFEFRHRRAGGSIRDVAVFSSHIVSGERSVLHSIIHDITDQKEAERALVTSEERMRSLLASIQDLVFVLDNDLVYREVYAPDDGLLYLDPEDFLGKSLYEMPFPEGARSAMQAALEHTLLTGEPRRAEYGLELQGKGYCSFDVWVSRYLSPSGEPVGLTCVVRDVTELKRAQEDLRRSEVLLSQAQEIAELGGWSMDVASGEIQWTEEAYKVFGYQQADFKPCYANIYGCIHPDDVEKVADAYTSSMQDGAPGCEIEHRIVRKDTGEVRHVFERYVHERDENGSVVRSLGVIQDITERVRAEEALRESELRLSLALEATDDVVWDWDIEADRQRWSSAGEAIFGWTDITRQPQPGGWWLERVHPDDRSRVVRTCQDRLDDPDEVKWSDEFRFLRADGRWAHILDRGTIVRDSDGRAVRMVGAITDLTEREEAKERIAYQLGHAELLLHIANSFVGVEARNEDQAIDRSLEALGRFVGADRAYAFDHDDLNSTVSNTHEWCDEGIDPMIDHLLGISLDEFQPDFVDVLQTGPLVVPDVQALGCDAMRETFDRQGIRSALLVPVLTDAGEFDGFVGFDWVRDLHEPSESEVQLLSLFVTTLRYYKSQRHARQVLGQSEVRYRTLFETMSYGVVAHDCRGRIIDCNPAAERILGRSREQILGKDSEDPAWRTVREDGSDFPGHEHPAAVAISTGMAVSGVLMGLDFPERGERRWIRVDAVPNPACDHYHQGGHQVEDEGVICVFVTFGDVTEQRRVEEEVRLLASQAEQAPFAILRTDTKRRITWGNAAFTEMTGYTLEEALGNSPAALLQGPCTDEAMILQMREALNSLEPVNVEVINYSKEGKPYWIQLTIAPLFGRNDEHVGYVGFEQEVTARVQAKEELEAAQRRLAAMNQDLEKIVADRTRMVHRQAAALDNSLEGVAIFDRDHWVYRNRAHIAMFGNELPGRSWCELFMSSSSGSLPVMERGSKVSWMGECVGKRADGSHFDVEVDTAKLPDGAILVVTRDITEKKRAERILAEREERYRAIMEGAGDAILTAATDGTVMEPNRMAQDLSGYTADELEGMSFAEMHPADALEKVEPIFREIARGCRTTAHDIPMRRKDGSIVYVDVTGQLVRFAGRELIIGIFRDITQRRETERELRELTEMLDLSLDSGNIGCWRLDLEHNTLTWDRRMHELYDLPVEEFTGHYEDWVKCLTPEDRERAVSEWTLSAETGRPFDTVFTIQTRSGEERSIQTRAVIFRDRHGKPVRAIGVNFDISPLVEREKKLEEANRKLEEATRQKDEFLANMSHELRTPLNSILGMSEALQMGVYGEISSKQAGSIERIEDSGRHLLDLIKDILDLAKIEAGKLEISEELINVRDSVQSAVRLVEETARTKDLGLSFEVDNAVPQIMADPRRLRQVLLNLLSNALKFTEAHGKVKVKTQYLEGKGRLEFRVTDSGIGIPPERLEMLFQPFTQLESTLTRRHGGTGLGLSIVKRLIEMHGGEVGVDSIHGKGSTFWFRLPCPDPHELVAAPLGDAIEGETEGARESTTTGMRERPRVLLVEDNDSNIRLITDFLAVSNYEVDVARNGLEAITHAAEGEYDVILMDIQMPEMDGYEATRRIRVFPGCETVPIIALTSFAMAGDREKCLAAGMTDYMSKPVSLRALGQLLKRTLRSGGDGAADGGRQ